MSARTVRWRPLAICMLVVATVFALAFASHVGAEVAQTSDEAGSAYATAIARAKQKRSAKLKKCNKKPSKAKRAACKKAAHRAYRKAKKTAQAKRDEAGNPGPTGEDGPPSSPAEDYRRCLDSGGDPSECKKAAKGPK